MERPVQQGEQPKPKLIRQRQVAALVNTNCKTIKNWSDRGLCPKPIRIGNGPKPTLRFREDEILQWIAAGCPAINQEGAER